MRGKIASGPAKMFDQSIRVLEKVGSTVGILYILLQGSYVHQSSATATNNLSIFPANFTVPCTP